MSLKGAGTVGNWLERSASLPDWAAFTVGGFIKLDADADVYQTVFNCGVGGGDGFVSGEIETDGISLSRYSERGTYSALLQPADLGEWYWVDFVVDGLAGRMRYVRLSDMATYTTTGTHGSSAGNMTLFQLGGYPYGTRTTLHYAGWKMWDSALTDLQLDAEMTSLRPVYTTGLRGSWPMDGADKAACLVDEAGLGDLTEVGATTDFTWTADLPPLAVEITGTLDVTLDDAVLTATATLLQTIHGTLNVTLDDAELSAVATLAQTIRADLNVTLDDAVLMATAVLRTPTPFYDVGVLKPEHIVEYLESLPVTPRKRPMTLTPKQVSLIARRADMLRRRAEGS